MRKSDYAKMFTLRADGYYQKKVKGKTRSADCCNSWSYFA